MKINVLYLIDNICYFISRKTNQLYKITYQKGVLKNGKIAKVNQFIKETKDKLVKNKLINI